MLNVFITGVSSGIGEGLASEYISRGESVFGISRRAPAQLMGHDQFHFVSQDLRELDAIAPAIGHLLSGVDHLDLMILNAGALGEISDMKDVPIAQLRELMDINVWANKAILDCVFDEVGHVAQVVTISSGASVNGNRGWNGYAISKSALNMLTQLYARENSKTHFTAFAPGLVDTSMQDYLCAHPADARFPSLENLKSRRHTAEMPKPKEAGKRLVNVIERLPELTASGNFVDIRQLPTRHSAGPKN